MVYAVTRREWPSSRYREVERVTHRLQRNVVAALQVEHGGAQAAGARGDDLLEILPVFRVLLQQAAMLQGTFGGAEKLGAHKGFKQVIDRAAAEGVGRNMEVIHTAQHDNGHARVVPADKVEQAEPVAPGIITSLSTRLQPGSSCR